MPSDFTLLIVGAGKLGRLVGALWREAHPGATVIAETRTGSSHARLAELGLSPRLRERAVASTFPNVLFSAPPTGSADYPAEAARAAKLWSGNGSLLFTSSTGVFTEESGGTVVETSPALASGNPLVDAESAFRRAGGAIRRLAGLYDEERGPHLVYLRQPESPLRPDGWLNLIHYADAAALCVRILSSQPGVYLGSDGNPVTRLALASTAFTAAARFRLAGEPQHCRFTGTSGPLGRRCDNVWTRRALGWEPHWKSFGGWVTA